MNTILNTAIETILLFGVSEAETKLISRLVSSFAIKTQSLSIKELFTFKNKYPERQVCLVVFHVGKDTGRQHRLIRLVREILGNAIPLLVLIPKENVHKTKRYLKAGGDDYLVLPLNENSFSVSFLILLEIGQAIIQNPQEKTVASRGYVWNRLVNYFQAEESYFSPKTLIQGPETDHILNKWQQIRRLGLGGFGVVWLVKEIATGRLAVSKTPHSGQMNIRALRSAAILKRLINHPNICQLIEILKHNGKFVLIQEYVEGSSLQDMLEKNILPRDKASYFLQLLSATAYSHKHKIMHRDIKPENIMITKGGQLKLLDFGIAQDLSWQSPSRSSEGTLNFMSPEQYEGKSCIASDIWSLGVILYIFATNAVPYYQCSGQYPVNIEDTLRHRAPAKITPGIDLRFEKIIMNCLEKDLSKRYKDGHELQTDLLTTLPSFSTGDLFPGS